MSCSGEAGCKAGANAAWRVARTVFHIVFAAALALYVVFTIIKCIQDVICPYNLDYVEGLMLSQAVRLARGEGIYNDYTHYPFVFSNYPPLYLALCAGGVKLWGVSFAFGRALSLGAMLGMAVVMMLLLRRCGVSLGVALGAPAFLLSTSIALIWGGLMHVDTLAILLSLLGLYAVLRGGRWLAFGVGFMVAAFYTKQSMLAALAAAAIYLWWTGQRKRAAVFVTAWAAAAGLLFLGLQAASDGWFFRHIVTATIHPWDLGRAARFVRVPYTSWPAVMATAALSAAVALAHSRVPRGDQPRAADVRPGERLLVAYYLCAAVLGVSAGKVGANVNYLVEPVAGGCMAAALGYQRLLCAFASRRARALWLALATALLWQMAAIWTPPWKHWKFVRDLRVRGAQAAERIIAATEGDIIGQPPGVLVTSNRPLLFDPCTASYMSLMGTWDPAPVLRDIRRRRFSLIFMTRDARWGMPQYGLYDNCWSQELMRAILAHYRDVGSAGDLCFLVPRQGRQGAPRNVKMRLHRGRPTPAQMGRRANFR